MWSLRTHTERSHCSPDPLPTQSTPSHLRHAFISRHVLGFDAPRPHPRPSPCPRLLLHCSAVAAEQCWAQVLGPTSSKCEQTMGFVIRAREVHPQVCFPWQAIWGSHVTNMRFPGG